MKEARFAGCYVSDGSFRGAQYKASLALYDKHAMDDFFRQDRCSPTAGWLRISANVTM
jgi:hypothetical protein